MPHTGHRDSIPLRTVMPHGPQLPPNPDQPPGPRGARPPHELPGHSPHHCRHHRNNNQNNNKRTAVTSGCSPQQYTQDHNHPKVTPALPQNTYHPGATSARATWLTLGPNQTLRIGDAEPTTARNADGRNADRKKKESPLPLPTRSTRPKKARLPRRQQHGNDSSSTAIARSHRRVSVQTTHRRLKTTVAAPSRHLTIYLRVLVLLLIPMRPAATQEKTVMGVRWRRHRR
ncbi:hypothetical protein F5144DRAFT_291765 [Chaetomium tenue]|uniref:Uncharacterized protein n=1 Tax=Chaetomium tenue TaxID=1854479 RepID=A0ACB7P6S2_9PEZI|nr:hypothetical protein F5144DRAFT_291765 [Chaetomium globosum]